MRFFFSIEIFEKLCSVFHQNANFQGLQPKKEIYFNDTHFKAEAIFRNYHLRNFTSFKKACFEQLAEFGIDEKYDMQLIDFTEVQMHFSPKSKWTTKYTTLLKIQQLRHLAWRLKNKKLNRKLSQLERLARRGVKLKQLLSQMKNFWQIDKKKRGFLGYFFRFIFFIFFVIPWGIRFLLFWPLGQLSIFFYGTKNHNNYIRSLFFLIFGSSCSSKAMEVVSESGRVSVAVSSVGFNFSGISDISLGDVFFVANRILLKIVSSKGSSVKQASKREKIDCAITML